MKTAERLRLVQDERAVVMGILNATPDSFSDGGFFLSPEAAIDHVAQMIESGADIIDVGGESTRPGAEVVSADEEMQRVVPVIEELNRRFDVIVSVDTSKAEVMKAAVSAGAGIINDVRALTEDNALNTAAELSVPVCLMHMQGQPANMQDKPEYNDVIQDIRNFLSQRVDACVAAGMDIRNLILDPGFGFGKTKKQNFILLNELEGIRVHDLPVLAGLSRKSVIQQALGLAVDERVYASVALALLAVQNGANIVRVHDVRATADALRMMEAVKKESKQKR